MIGDCQHLPTFDSARQSELQAMGSKKLSVDLRNKIVSRHRSGEGYGKISAALQAPESTVATIIRKWKKFGTTKNLPRPGRPAKLSIRGRPALAREVSRKSRVSLWRWENLSEDQPSKQHSSRLYGRVARRKPLLSKRHITARLAFAKRYLEDFQTMRNKILWSDETKIELTKRHVWRKHS